MYDLFKFLHVAAVVVWVGSGFGLVALMATIGRAGDRSTLAGVGRHMEVLGKRLFGPAAGLTLVFGVITVLLGEWSFRELWIILGLVGFAASGVATMLANPVRAKLAKLSAEGGDPAQMAALVARTRMLSVVDLLILFAVIADMVFKPHL